MDERRVESEQEQAVTYGKRVIKDAIAPAHNDVTERLPGNSRAGTEVASVGFIQRRRRYDQLPRCCVEI